MAQHLSVWATANHQPWASIVSYEALPRFARPMEIVDPLLTSPHFAGERVLPRQSAPPHPHPGDGHGRGGMRGGERGARGGSSGRGGGRGSGRGGGANRDHIPAWSKLRPLSSQKAAAA